MAAIENKKSQVNEEAILYQARTTLADLANQIAAIRKLESPEAIALIDRAAKVRFWLKALDYKEFLQPQQRQQIWYKLIEISQIYNFPTSPILQLHTRPNILTGEPGPPGAKGADGSGKTAFSVPNVDIGVNVIDSFALGLSRGAIWQYALYDATNGRTGSIAAFWTADGATINAGADIAEAQIGDTSVIQLTVDIAAGLVRLLATTSTNNWTLEGNRFLV